MNPHVTRPARACSRLVLALAALCSGPQWLFARGDEPPSIDWRDDYASTLEESRTANRLLWIQFTGPWCPNCTRMERDSFPQPAIVELQKRSFVAVKLRSDLNEGLVAAFNLTAIPATIIVAPNRDIVAIHQGYLGPDQLDAILRDCLARVPLKPETKAASGSGEATAALPGEKKDEQPVAERAAAVSGYCAVSLVDERKLVKGRSENSIAHEGNTYRFSSPAAGERFREQPARYVPWGGGSCPVTQLEHARRQPGDPRWGVLYAGRLFLCASEEDRRRFIANPSRYAALELAVAGSSCADSLTQNEVNR
jgi:YHS domain-containing protein/thioredoxin-related protein